MKYLHGFQLEEQFNAEYYDDNKYFEPWVSLTKEIERVDYNKKQAGEYLSFEILTSGELYLGEILFSELENSFRNTIKNDESNSDDYMYIDKLNSDLDEEEIGIGDDRLFDKSTRTRALRSSKNSPEKKFNEFLQEFPSLPGIKYSINDGEWTDWEIDENTYYRTLTVQAGDIVRIKGDMSYPNIFEGSGTWIDPRDIDNTEIKVVDKQSETIQRTVTITLDHSDIDFDTTSFGGLNNINSWYRNDLFPNNGNDDIDFIDNSVNNPDRALSKDVLMKGASRGGNISDFSTSINGNLFSYKGKIKYRFENVTFNTISPVQINNDTIINCLFEYTSQDESPVPVIFPKLFETSYANNFLRDINYSDIVSIDDTDDSHIKYLSYHVYHFDTQPIYSYYGTTYETVSSYVGISVFGFLLYNDNGELIGYAPVYDTLENVNGNPYYYFQFLYPNTNYYQAILDYIYNDNFSDKLTLVFDASLHGGSSPIGGGPKNLSKGFTEVDSSSVLFIFTYDIEYISSLKNKYNYGEDSFILSNKRFNFRGSDTCTFNVFGNICSLYYGDDFLKHVKYTTEELFAGLFYHCDSLISCKDISLYGYYLSPRCYFGMFSYCTNLIEVFDSFNERINYEEEALACMFFGCTSLTKTIEFPLSSEYPGLFYGMYYGCSNLTEIIGIDKFSYINDYEFAYTFSNCDSLEEIPDLSSFNIIRSHGCFCMFSNCNSLEEIPDLHFPVVFDYGVAGMFYNCQSIETIGEISFDNIYYNGAEKMFARCSSLINTDKVYCNDGNSYDYAYAYMFSECIELVNPPLLPQEKLSPYCYYKMFYKCHKLLSSPSLPATEGKLGDTSSNNGNSYGTGPNRGITTASRGTSNVVNGKYLSPGCYESMFEDCILLNITQLVLPAAKLHNRCYYKMFKNCQSLTKMPTIQAKEVGSYSFAFMFSHCTALTETSPIPGLIPINAGNSGGCVELGSVNTLNLNLLGNTRDISESIENSTDYNYIYGPNTGEGAFSNMFEYCTSLVTMPDIYCVTFTESMCYRMFYNCTALRNSKNFHALLLDSNCFSNMFENCISLISTPRIDHNLSMESFFEAYPPDDYDISYELEREIRYQCETIEEFEQLDLSLQSITDNLFIDCNRRRYSSYMCYKMFYNCTSLTTVNDIYLYYPYEYSFYEMFYNCTSLQNISSRFIKYSIDSVDRSEPKFTLSEYSCSGMFYNCISLVSVPTNFLDIFDTFYTCSCEEMFRNCISLIQAPEIPDISYSTSNAFNSMFYNCTSLQEVYLNILNRNNCNTSSFDNMFENCSSLNKIHTVFQNTESQMYSRPFYNWVYGVSSTGMFYEDFNYSWDIRGDSYIPENWEIRYDDSVETYITTSNTTVSFIKTPDSEKEVSFVIKESYTCSITNNLSWITTARLDLIETLGGIKFYMCYILPSENNTGETRTGTITINVLNGNTIIDSFNITINQLAINPNYTINLNNGKWEEYTSQTGPNGETIYRSTNYHQYSSVNSMSITIFGYTEFTIKVKTYGEENWDYVSVSKLDEIPEHGNNNNYTGTHGVKWSGRAKSNASTWYDVPFTNISQNEYHTITIIYGKDGSGDSYDDRGYVYIPMN